ncbi:hypothetical protein ACFQE8_04495 [Salinirubellus sp. GCM10025818]|uniref:PspA-associated protein PspAB n=1 Tax=Salinirubellus TaxID=2162630 RepID=UPI0030D03A38
MGIFDTLREVLGVRAETDAARNADPDDLFGMTTAYVTMEADLGYVPTSDAALCFSGVDSSQFADAVEEVEAILEAGEKETGTEFEVRGDSKGYEWVVLHDDDFEDLVTSVHFAADTLVEHGFGSRLLAALFSFTRETPGSRGGDGSAAARDRDGTTAYWIYSFRRGSFYPFVPEANRERDSSAEFKLQSVLDGEIEVEDDTSYWYPLWPEGNGHPWG